MDLREQDARTTLEAGQAGTHSRHPWELARLRVVLDQVHARRRERQAPLRTVVDVGCGDGFVIRNVADALGTAECHAVDVNLRDEHLVRLRQQHGDRPIAFYRTLDELDAAGVPRIDLVLLLDVLEHVEDDARFLRAIRSLPVDSATDFLITVPAWPWLATQHDVLLDHHRRYTRRSLAALLERSGYACRNSSYFFASLVPIRAAQVLRERIGAAPSETSSPLARWRARGRVARWATRALALDYAVGRRLARVGVALPGLSVMCTAHLGTD